MTLLALALVAALAATILLNFALRIRHLVHEAEEKTLLLNFASNFISADEAATAAAENRCSDNIDRNKKHTKTFNRIRGKKWLMCFGGGGGGGEAAVWLKSSSSGKSRFGNETERGCCC